MAEIQKDVQQGHGHDFVAANKEFFNSTNYSNAYDNDPLFIATVDKYAKEMLKFYPFDKDNTMLMDFACGTGLASRNFAPHVKSLLGVDISQGMLNQFDKRAMELGLGDKVRSVCLELKGEEGELDKLGGAKFDIITCTAAFHHFEDLPKMTSILVSFLKPGGALIVAENGRAHGHHHGHGHGEAHGHGHGHEGQGHDHASSQGQDADSHTQPHVPDSALRVPEHHLKDIIPHRDGFTEEGMKKLFEDAGLVDFEMKKNVANAKLWNDVEVEIFIAKGVKPNSVAIKL